MDFVPGDLDQRLRALDPRQSFIVQAPAGSGKTELLIQRFLVLLSSVGQPEEIAAITFTRKSAAEMRKRVLDALAAAGTEPRPGEPHRALTWDHARAALERDREREWHLEANTARLRVQTIDALCVSLTRQMPVLSAFGAQPENLDDASDLYREAALATLALLDEAHPAADDVAKLLAHLDNNFDTAIGLLCSMLATRDQWLRLGRSPDRGQLEQALGEERAAAVRKVESIYRAPGVSGVDAWKQHAAELLTQKGTWRVNSAAAQSLSQRDDEETLREHLHELQRLPPEKYDEVQWAVMGAMTRLLPFAVAQLKLVFAARGQADFVEIARGAIQALGEPDAPTDLMLALDYRIRHLLVDEFQDTSFTQYELLERLTGGWEPGDGRTLFLVGDPMQSIYRFREAEVSLFLRAQSQGIGGVRLVPLTLSANFRSQADIVDWVNETFERVLPLEENIAEGAVPYARSEAVRPITSFDGGVSVHAFFNGDQAGEAEQLVSLVRSAQDADPEGTVAVLVRNRPHLDAIVPALKAAGLRFRAIEIEELGHRQVVQDLLALTRALSHPADRAAWLALLRAPWCGLKLADLHALTAGEAPASAAARPSNSQDLFPETLSGSASPPNASIKTDTRTVWEMLHDESRAGRLDADGRARLERVLPVLERAMSGRLRGSLRSRVETAWLELGGPACVGDDTDLEDAAIYLDCLERHEHAGELDDPAGFEGGLADLYALPDLEAGPADVQLLTIHKAKGLEFDTVIVPGLGAAPRRPDPSLLVWAERPAELHWDERPAESGAGSKLSRLLLAPIRAVGAKNDAIYDYLARLDRRKESHEDARLLYVAATRARTRLHLLGDTRCEDEHGDLVLRDPASRSLLEKLWPAVSDEFAEQMLSSPGAVAHAEPLPPAIDQRLRRVPLDWRVPEPPPAAAWSAPPEPLHLQDEIEFSWAGETARRVGSVVHRWLQRIAEDGLEGWSRERIAGLRECVVQELAARGLARAEVAQAAGRVIGALENSIAHERGRWTLGPRRDARSELRLSALIDGRPALLVIDRVFTGEDGRRWIVDFKTSAHEGADREAFLDRERERYAAQLERYARALGWKDAMLGLYFPLLGGWREWPAG